MLMNEERYSAVRTYDPTNHDLIAKLSEIVIEVYAPELFTLSRPPISRPPIQAIQLLNETVGGKTGESRISQ